ncbi:MAG: carboxylesterase family protein [Kocuria sp.]|nr:carboxylesterase family protein [Kocuria sp.]
MKRKLNTIPLPYSEIEVELTGAGIAIAKNLRYALLEHATAHPKTIAIGSQDLPPILQSKINQVSPQSIPWMASKWSLPEDDYHQSAHCQYLSVFMPENYCDKTQKLRPVMIWVHGGGNKYGQGNSVATDPTSLVLEQDLVVVTVNYRLGILGFGGDGFTFPKNLGLFDLLSAMEWVRHFIKYFGGDPENVTLAGQSSGAENVLAIVASPEANDLFHKAIIQSAPIGLPKAGKFRQKILTQIYRKTRTPKNLVGLSRDQILNVQGKVLRRLRLTPHAALPFSADWSAEPLKNGHRTGVKITKGSRERYFLLGATTQETSIYLKSLHISCGPFNHLSRCRTFMNVIKSTLVHVSTKIIFICPTRRLTGRISATAERAYFYESSWSPGEGSVGAAHTTDLALLFGGNNAWKDSPIFRHKSRTPASSGKCSSLNQQSSISVWENAGRHLREIWGKFMRTGEIDCDSLSTKYIVLNQVESMPSGVDLKLLDGWSLRGLVQRFLVRTKGWARLSQPSR